MLPPIFLDTAAVDNRNRVARRNPERESRRRKKEFQEFTSVPNRFDAEVTDEYTLGPPPTAEMQAEAMRIWEDVYTPEQRDVVSLYKGSNTLGSTDGLFVMRVHDLVVFRGVQEVPEITLPGVTFIDRPTPTSLSYKIAKGFAAATKVVYKLHLKNVLVCPVFAADPSEWELLLPPYFFVRWRHKIRGPEYTVYFGVVSDEIF